jgi:hypothetical protein
MNQPNAGSESSSGKDGFSAVGAKSHEAAEQLKNKVVGQVEGVRDRAESAKAETADRIRRVATQLRSVGETLRADDSVAASLAERASQGIEGVARYVSATDARGFVRDAEQIARRQPALFFGSAFLLGLAAGRFLKSSSGGDVSQPRLNSPRGQSRPEPWTREDERTAFTGEGNAEPAQRRASSPRFQANYDATLGRDVDVPRETSSTTGVGSAAPRTPGLDTEKNGGAGRAKGVAP